MALKGYIIKPRVKYFVRYYRKDIPMEFHIKEARERAGFSQKELAKIIGVAPNTFHGYESGKHDPKSDLLIKIAQACHVTTDFLLGYNIDTELTPDIKQRIILSCDEENIIKKYRTLDEYGKKMIDVVLAEEIARIDKEHSTTRFPQVAPPPEDVDIEAEVEEYRRQLELQAKVKAKSSVLRNIK